MLYAIPVRHGLPLQTAQMVRLWLLAIVAGWRVGLLVFYLRRRLELAGARWLLCSLFPLLLIIFVITALNLEQVVFDFMGGLRPEDRSVNDNAYGAMMFITLLSMLAFSPFLAFYLAVSVASLMEKYGRHLRRYFYALAVVTALGGVALGVYLHVFLGMVALGAAVVIAATASLKMRNNSSEVRPAKKTCSVETNDDYSGL